MLNQYNIVLNSEKETARRVALCIIVKRPVKLWMQLIPGMFVIEYLIRGLEIRKQQRYYIPVRKIAIDEASAFIEDENSVMDLEGIRERSRAWLDKEGLYSEKAHQRIIELIDLLIEHYKRVLAASGESFDDLIREVYVNPSEYNDFLRKQTALEKEFIDAVLEGSDIDETLTRIIAERESAVKEQRENDVDRIF